MKRNLMRMRANRLRIKGNALLLCVLVLFGLFAHSKAEAKEMIPTDYFSEFVFERLSIPTMFDASYEDLQKMIVIPNRLGMVEFSDKVLPRDMCITTTMNKFTIIKDSKKISKSNQKLLDEGKGILRSDLQNRITNYLLNNLNILGGDRNKIVSHSELVSGTYVSFCENKMGLGDLDFNYLAKYATYTGERDDVPYSYGAVNWKFKDYVAFLVEYKYVNENDVPYELMDQEITIEQFINDIYLKIIPYYRWPIDVSFVKDGIFIPELSEEERNKKINESTKLIGAGLVLNENDTVGKVILYKYDKDKNEYYDFYTNLIMDLDKVDVWTTVNGEPLQFEEAYHILSGYDKQVASYGQVFLAIRLFDT